MTIIQRIAKGRTCTEGDKELYDVRNHSHIVTKQKTVSIGVVKTQTMHDVITDTGDGKKYKRKMK
jgi:hypothetical protein